MIDGVRAEGLADWKLLRCCCLLYVGTLSLDPGADDVASFELLLLECGGDDVGVVLSQRF